MADWASPVRRATSPIAIVSTRPPCPQVDFRCDGGADDSRAADTRSAGLPAGMRARGAAMTNAARMLVFSTLCAACAQGDPPPLDEPADPPPEAVADASPGTRIDVAMSGAPMAIAAQARIVELDASGGMVELRPGSNGWLC